MKNSQLFCLILFFFLFAKSEIIKAQTDFDINKVPYIDVTTNAYREVVPDEIYISIILRERMDNKVKITIDSLERQLTDALKASHIDVKNLSTRDLQSGYVKISWRNKDLMQTKEFSLKVSTADEVQNVFQIIYDQHITTSSIWKTDYSKRDSLEKVLRIEAINKATPQALYTLQPLGKFPGKVLIVSDADSRNNGVIYSTMGGMAAKTAGVYQADSYNRYGYSTTVEFQKIRIESTMFVRFQIGL